MKKESEARKLYRRFRKYKDENQGYTAWENHISDMSDKYIENLFKQGLNFGVTENEMIKGMAQIDIKLTLLGY